MDKAFWKEKADNEIAIGLLLTPFRTEILSQGGGGGDSHMKQTGMLVVSLRGINFGFWSRLGCSAQSANILSCQSLI